LAVVAAKPLPPLNGNVGVRQRGCGGLLSLRIAGAVARADAGERGDQGHAAGDEDAEQYGG
jgi:hypothetical protein